MNVNAYIRHRSARDRSSECRRLLRLTISLATPRPEAGRSDLTFTPSCRLLRLFPRDC